jgi:hypothetical protein
MRHLRFTVLATALFVALVGNARAQENLPYGPENYEHDFQMFAPYSLDLDNMADKQWSGYYFNYDKLFWAYSGERVTVGSSNVSETITFNNGVTNLTLTATDGEFAEIIYRVNPQDIPFIDPNNPVPAPHVIHNTLNNVPPKAGFAMGNRYQFGYKDQGHGWMIGVLQGPEQNQTQTYGFTPGPNGELPPFIDPDYTGPNDISGPGRTLITAAPGLRAFGWGSVPVLFDTPPGYLVGFRDYLNNLADSEIGTQVGPMAYVGNYGASVEVGALPFIFFRLADDLNGNGLTGGDIVLITGPDGVTRVAFIRDFGDLHKFNIFFDTVTVHNTTQTDGVELMWTHDLTNQNYMAKHQNNQLTVAWGARFLRLSDEFDVNAEGSILGHSFWNTRFTNNIVGPQVALQWVNERQRWRTQVDARFMAGYNVANWEQNGLMGEELIPGALNRPLYARPTAFTHGLRENQFAPVGELRIATSYHVTSAFAVNLGYTGSVLAGIRRAATSVHYNLPDMGFLDAGTQEFLINGFDLGVEFVH